MTTRFDSASFLHGIMHLLRSVFMLGSFFVVYDPCVEASKQRSWMSVDGVQNGPSRRTEFGFMSSGGMLFVFGGTVGYSPHETTINELHRFNPSTMVWTDLTGQAEGFVPPPTSYCGIAAADNKIFVFGGGGPQNNWFVFDPLTLFWKNLGEVSHGTPPSPRVFPALESTDDMLYVFGGIKFVEIYGDFHRYDPSSLSWTDLTQQTTGTTPSPRFGTRIFSSDGQLYLFGGQIEWVSPVTLGDLHLFNPSIMHWTDLSDKVRGASPSPRAHHGLAGIAGKLFIFGGFTSDSIGLGRMALNDLYELDTSTLTWSELKETTRGSSPAARGYHGFSAANDRLYVFGGTSALGAQLNDLFSLDAASYTWSDLSWVTPQIPPVARAFAGFASADTQLFVFGGLGTSGYLGDLHRFDPATFIWTDLGQLSHGPVPTPRAYPGFVSVQQHLYVFGGQVSQEKYVNDLYRFDLSTLVWSNFTGKVRGNSPSKRYGHGFAAIGRKLFVCGGAAGSILDDMYQFDTDTLTWTVIYLSPKQLKIAFHGMTSSGGQLFVFGGQTFPGDRFNGNELYLIDPFALSNNSKRLSLNQSGTPPAERANLGFTSFNDYLYVFGGRASSGLVLNDLHQISLATLEWKDLGVQLEGLAPTAVSGPGLVCMEGILFINGGTDAEGVMSSKTNRLVAPAVGLWPVNAGVDSFIEIYDWDKILISASQDFVLAWSVQLCTRIFPCRLTLSGRRGGKLIRMGNSLIACHTSKGCTTLSVDSLQISCDDTISSNSVFVVHGAELKVNNCSFTNCYSHVDGGAILSFGNSIVNVDSTSFEGIQSLGSGGAIRLAGGSLHVRESNFTNCSAVGGGGAISASSFECYSDSKNFEPSVLLEKSSFQGCTSLEGGGAIVFFGDITANVYFSVFRTCNSKTTGGALSASESASVTVVDSAFDRNTAYGFGGGALHAHNAELNLHGLACSGNRAESGGGGVLYWSGGSQPNIVVWCLAGWMSESDTDCTSGDCIQKCVPCPPGSFQTSRGATECSLCNAGTFSTTSGAFRQDTCINCDAGKFLTTLGANHSSDCVSCDSGQHSPAGASNCFECAAGKYFSEDASSSCISCKVGTYSTSSTALSEDSCLACDAGKYSSRDGSSSCDDCWAGAYSTLTSATSLATCVTCGAGQYSTSAGAQSSAECATCREGTFSVDKHFLFKFYGPDTGSRYQWADSDFVCGIIGGKLATIDSEYENQDVLNVLSVLPPYFDFWIGYHFESDHHHWSSTDIQSASNYTNWGALNPKDGPLPWDCAAFANYAYPSMLNPGLNPDFPFSSQDMFGSLSSASYSGPAGSWYNYDCSNPVGWVGGVICSLTGATSCLECEAGKYSDTRGATSPASCLPCPSGTFSNASGASTCVACQPNSNDPSLCDSEPENRRLVQKSGRYETSSLEARKKFTLKSRMMQPSSTPNIRGTRLQSQNWLEATGDSRQRSAVDGVNTRGNIGTSFSSSTSNEAVLARGHNEMAIRLCGPSNAASYGPCLASPASRLEVLGLPGEDSPAFPGIEFPIEVIKVDWYNQTILSDSSSFLQTELSRGGLEEPDTFTSLSGISVARVQRGRATFSVSMKPTYSVVDASVGRTETVTVPHIYIQGLDYETKLKMQSRINAITVANGSSICPRGSILALDPRAGNAGRGGRCVFCSPGSYSLLPLFALGFGNDPACLNCPVAANCLKGGWEVTFSLGKWIIDGGIYRLITCPQGYALVNSIDGVFSHDAQRCALCLPTQYVLNSSNSRHSCQNCPVGAVCNGSDLVGKVEGSLWVPNFETGRFSLKRCPPGYALVNSNAGTFSYDSQSCAACASGYVLDSTSSDFSCQDCPVGARCVEGTLEGLVAGSEWIANASAGIYVLKRCPAGYELVNYAGEDRVFSQVAQRCAFCRSTFYCEGGTSSAVACRGGGFSLPGSNSSKSCIAVVYVQITVTLPLSQASFKTDDQNRFAAALASAAGTSAGRVIIVSLTASRRTDGIVVVSNLAAESQDQARAWRDRVDAPTLNAALAQQNLPPSLFISSTITSEANPSTPAPNSTPLIASVVVSLSVLLLACAGLAVWHSARQRHALWMIEPEELHFDDPPLVLGRGTFGMVLKAEYRGTKVAVKQVIPSKPATAVLTTSGEGGADAVVLEFDAPPGQRPLLGGSMQSDGSLQSSMFYTNGSMSMMDSAPSWWCFGVLPALGGSKEGRRRRQLREEFLEEMHLVSKLRHPCITTVMGAVLGDRRSREPQLVMELMHHGSLFDLLHNDSVVLEGDILLSILRDVVQGMRFLHAATPPIIHSDLKAANVLVDDNFRAKVSDFGLSQKQKSGLRGTPLWMAPELLAGEAPTRASDVYAFGITLYEVFSRKVPFEDEPLAEVLTQIREDPGKRPVVPKECPALIEAMMVECWSHAPAVRPTFEALDGRMSIVDLSKFTDTMLDRLARRRGSFLRKRSEGRRADNLLKDVFPRHVAEALMAGRRVEPESRESVTIFFCDIVGFTTISATLPAEKVSDMLDRLYLKFDELSYDNGVFKVDIIGDAWMGVTNLVEDQEADHVARMARFSMGVMRAAGETPIDTADPARGTVRIRAGFHSGPVVANVLGKRAPRYSVYGDTVNTASRMESTSVVGRIQCSERSAALLRGQAPDVPLAARGVIEVKGKGTMSTYWVGLPAGVAIEAESVTHG